MPTQDDSREEAGRRQRGRNLAILAVLLGFVALIYLITLVRMGGAE